MSRSRRTASLVVVLCLTGAIACGQASAQAAKAQFRTAKGEMVGTVTLVQEPDGVRVTVEASALPAGLHGFHIHAVGKCEPPFTSAGSHFDPAGRPHPAHAGDLPNLLVNDDGKASLVVMTTRFKLADLFDADGSAFIIHADPDNHANLPARYGTPDDATLATGDAGDRIACAVIAR